MQKRGRPQEDNEIYKWLAGYVAYYAKDYDRAIAEFAGGNLADPFVLFMLGQSYQAKGDLQNARAYYQRTLDSNVHNLQASIARPQAREKLVTMRRALQSS
jgi:tetratricopeptide (TPR) repeat protein